MRCHRKRQAEGENGQPQRGLWITLALVFDTPPTHTQTEKKVERTEGIHIAERKGSKWNTPFPVPLFTSVLQLVLFFIDCFLLYIFFRPLFCESVYSLCAHCVEAHSFFFPFPFIISHLLGRYSTLRAVTVQLIKQPPIYTATLTHGHTQAEIQRSQLFLLVLG